MGLIPTTSREDGGDAKASVGPARITEGEVTLTVVCQMPRIDREGDGTPVSPVQGKKRGACVDATRPKDGTERPTSGGRNWKRGKNR